MFRSLKRKAVNTKKNAASNKRIATSIDANNRTAVVLEHYKTYEMITAMMLSDSLTKMALLLKVSVERLQTYFKQRDMSYADGKMIQLMTAYPLSQSVEWCVNRMHHDALGMCNYFQNTTQTSFRSYPQMRNDYLEYLEGLTQKSADAQIFISYVSILAHIASSDTLEEAANQLNMPLLELSSYLNNKEGINDKTVREQCEYWWRLKLLEANNDFSALQPFPSVFSPFSTSTSSSYTRALTDLNKKPPVSIHHYKTYEIIIVLMVSRSFDNMVSLLGVNKVAIRSLLQSYALSYEDMKMIQTMVAYPPYQDISICVQAIKNSHDSSLFNYLSASHIDYMEIRNRYLSYINSSVRRNQYEQAFIEYVSKIAQFIYSPSSVSAEQQCSIETISNGLKSMQNTSVKTVRARYEHWWRLNLLEDNNDFESTELYPKVFSPFIISEGIDMQTVNTSSSDSMTSRESDVNTLVVERSETDLDSFRLFDYLYDDNDDFSISSTFSLY